MPANAALPVSDGRDVVDEGWRRRPRDLHRTSRRAYDGVVGAPERGGARVRPRSNASRSTATGPFEARWAYGAGGKPPVNRKALPLSDRLSPKTYNDVIGPALATPGASNITSNNNGSFLTQGLRAGRDG